MFLKLLEEYPGTIIGIGIGILLGLVFLIVGFWKTIIFVGFILLGLSIGKRYDKRENFQDILDDILPDKFFK